MVHSFLVFYSQFNLACSYLFITQITSFDKHSPDIFCLSYIRQQTITSFQKPISALYYPKWLEETRQSPERILAKAIAY